MLRGRHPSADWVNRAHHISPDGLPDSHEKKSQQSSLDIMTTWRRSVSADVIPLFINCCNTDTHRQESETFKGLPLLEGRTPGTLPDVDIKVISLVIQGWGSEDPCP